MQTVLYFQKLFYRYAYNEKGSVDAHTFHHHLDYELLIVLKGRGQFLIGSHSYQVSPGTLILIPPGNYHIMNVSDEYVYERVAINFPLNALPENLSVPTPIVGKQTLDTQNITSRILEYQNKFDSKKFEMLLTSLVSEFTVIFEEQKDSCLISRERLPELVFKAVNYIRDNIYHPLNAEIIANNLFVSKSYLINKFRDTMTTTLGDYIRIQKMLKARELLTQGFSPTEVCEMLGYNAYSTFLRNYRMEFQSTPKEISKN